MFIQARKCLEAQSKEIKKRKERNKRYASEVFSDVKKSIVYEKSLLGISNAEALLNTVWLFSSVHLVLPGCESKRRRWLARHGTHMKADGTEY